MWTQEDSFNSSIALMGSLPTGQLDMGAWQRGAEGGYRQEETLPKDCGTVCCYGGWTALSGDFHKLGGGVDTYGMPTFRDGDGDEAIAAWLCISLEDSQSLCLSAGYAPLNTYLYPHLPQNTEEGLPGFLAEYDSVTPSHVVAALETLKAKYAKAGGYPVIVNP